MKLHVRLSFLFLCLLVACQKDVYVEPAPLQTALTPQVVEAKTWFGLNVSGDSNSNSIATTVDHTSAKGTNAGHKMGYQNATPNWELATAFIYENGQAALRMPMHFNIGVKRFTFRKRGTPKSQSQYQVPDPELFIFKDKSEHFHLEVREFSPDQSYSVAHHGTISLTNYSGDVTFYDWHGQLLRGYHYSDGQRVGRLTPSLDATNGRIPLITARKGSNGTVTTNDYNVCVTYYESTFTKFCRDPDCGCERSFEQVYARWNSNEQPPDLDEGGPIDTEYSGCHWVTEGADSYQQCTYVSDPNDPGPGSDPGNGGGGGSADGSGGSTGSAPLESVIITDAVALFPPCPGLTDAWIPLINFKAPSSVITRLNNLTARQLEIVKLTLPYSSVDPLWQIQAIQNAGGQSVNLDRFSVTMTQMPTVGGVQLTPSQFLEYIRTNINDFVGPGQPTFTPQTLLPGEDARWQNHELGSVVSINIPLDDGSVILSDYSQNDWDAHWTFSTLHDPYNGSHPVSGTRTFGISTNYGYRDPIFGFTSPTTYTFYIQGADRILSRPGELFGSLVNLSTNPANAFQYGKADEAWNSAISQVANFLNSPSHGGNTGVATINTPVTTRPNWSDVYSALQNHRPLSTVPCN